MYTCGTVARDSRIGIAGRRGNDSISYRVDKVENGWRKVSMGQYTNEELEQFLDDLEAANIERKSRWSSSIAKKVRETICAFTNDYQNLNATGILFIGANDDGTPCEEFQVSDKMMLDIANLKTDGNIVPPPIMSVEKITLKNKDMVVIFVEPSNSPPVRYDGRVHIRVGSQQTVASEQDEKRLWEKRRYKMVPTDLIPIEPASIDDLDLSFFNMEYLPGAFARDIILANNRSDLEKLASCKMIASLEHKVPTVLGLLVLSPLVRDYLPGAYIQFLRIDGLELSDPIIDAESIDGPLRQMLTRLDDKLKSHNRESVQFTQTDREVRSLDYPIVALQQLCRNAVMHRMYEATNAPVRIYWFSDRIEVISPGGPYGAVTKETFGKPGYCDYRNPNLAESMKVLGFVQKFGAGIATAKRALSDNGNPEPLFCVEDLRVLCTIWRKK